MSFIPSEEEGCARQQMVPSHRAYESGSESLSNLSGVSRKLNAITLSSDKSSPENSSRFGINIDMPTFIRDGEIESS